jgi:hypothetical protein
MGPRCRWDVRVPSSRRAAKFAIERKTLRAKIMVPAVLFGLAVALNVIGFGLLGLNY